MFAHMALCWPHLKINLHDDGDGSGGKPTIVAAVSCHAPRSLTAPKKATETTTTTKAVSGRLQGYTCSSPDLLFFTLCPHKSLHPAASKFTSKSIFKSFMRVEWQQELGFQWGGKDQKI